MTKEEFDNSKKLVITNIAKVLCSKNERYGNSALEPIGIFWKGTSNNSICVRLDDKINRIINSAEGIRKNDAFDILGYLWLLSISEGYYGTEPTSDFSSNVQSLMVHFAKACSYDEGRVSAFCKGSTILARIDDAINDIKMEQYDETMLEALIVLIIKYFIETNITDFSELID